jgi:outer membrane receptor protein involved in Fe transport
MYKYLLILVCFSGFSQKSYQLKGRLVDSLSAEILPFATIGLTYNESNHTQSAVADEKAQFEWTDLMEGDYTIKFQYVGYQTKVLRFVVGKSSNPLNLGDVFLSPVNQTLESVTISSEKPKVIATLEKQVFKANQFEVAKGGTAIDVLKNIPSIMVNAEGELSMRGSKGFLILINGKPTQVDASTILSQISANTIENIELITAPSAKYDADGKAGIINITTKKETNEGWSLTTNVQYGLPRIKEYENESEPNRQGIDFSSTYQKGKWDISASFSYMKNDIAGRREGDVNTTINNVFTSFPSEGERSLKRENLGFRSSFQFTPTKNDEILAGIYVGKREQYRQADILYNNVKYDLSTNRILGRANYFNTNLVLKSGSFNVYNIDYTHRFLDKSSISISGLYEYAMLDGYTKNRNLRADNYADTLQYTLNTGENPLNAYRIKIDYEKIIGIGKMTIGYQFRNQLQKGIFNYFEKTGNASALLFNPNFSAEIQVMNKIHGAFIQYGGTYKKMEFSMGLRYENALREFSANKGTINSLLELSNFFPSANLLYNAKDDLRIKLAYSKRVQRSTNNELNPYPEREHSETLEQGDPSIRPEFISILETGVAKDFRKGSIYVNLYTQNIDNMVNRVNSVYNDTILNRIYTNAGKAILAGSEVGINYNPTKKLKLFLGGNVYQLNINGALFNNTVSVNSSGFVYSLNSNLSYQFNDNTSAQFNLAYLSAKNTAQGIDSRFYQPNVSIKKSLMANKLSLTLQWQNLAFGNMKVNEQSISTRGSNFYTITNYIQEQNIIMVNLSYNFRSSTKKAKLPTSEFAEKEF